jgi:hypothetical protein
LLSEKCGQLGRNSGGKLGGIERELLTLLDPGEQVLSRQV